MRKQKKPLAILMRRERLARMETNRLLRQLAANLEAIRKLQEDAAAIGSLPFVVT